MKDPNQTMLEVIHHMLTLHPGLAPAVEELALIAQGKDQATLRKNLEARLFQGLNTQQIFTKIYTERLWGHPGDPAHVYWSGTGSHVEGIVRPYVESVARFLQTLGAKPDVVDLGCGDFSVGSKLRAFCGNYIACDIVEPLIAHNKTKYQDLDVDFRVLDMSSDAIPGADIVFVRQVFQHLSNAEIVNVVRQIEKKFKYLVLTDHVPMTQDFQPNIDKATGRDVRIGMGSGIVLTSPPFGLAPVHEQVLCEAPEAGGIIRTTLYQLA